MHYELFYKFKPWQGEVPAEFQANFLGVKTDSRFFSNGNHNAPDPYPPFDEKYFKWIDMLEAVAGAEKSFTMIESDSQCGYWLANAAAALLQYGKLDYRLIGVEAEPVQFQVMCDHLRYNNVDLQRCELVQAMITEKENDVRARETGLGGQANGNAHSVEDQPQQQTVSLSAILKPLEKVDLTHLDLGARGVAVLESAVSELDAKVKRVYISTHDPEAEERLRALFRGLGWRNINDFHAGWEYVTEWGRITFQDGIQSWINPKLCNPEVLNELSTTSVRTSLGFTFRLGRDDYITKLLRHDEIFESAETELVNRLVRPGDVCLDGGCHIGYYTCLLAYLAGPTGRVFAFDGNPACCRRAEQNLSLNHLQAEVTHAVLGNGQGSTDFHISSDDQTGLSSIGDIPTCRQTIKVPWLRLEDFIKKQKIASVRLLKLDLEGAEELALQGLGPVLAAHTIDYILLECYDERLKQVGGSVEKVAAILQTAGYDVWEYGTQKPSGWSHTARVVSRGDCNYLFSSPRASGLVPEISIAGPLTHAQAQREWLEQQLGHTRRQLSHTQRMATSAAAIAREEKSQLIFQVGRLQEDLDFTLDQMQDKDGQIRAKEAEKGQVYGVLHAMQNSKGWRLLCKWRSLRDRLVPEGTRLRKLYEKMLRH